MQAAKLLIFKEVKACGKQYFIAGAKERITKFQKGKGDYMRDYELDFDTEFMTDDEIEEMMDGLILDIAYTAAEEDRRTAIINMPRIQQVLLAYNALKYMTKGKNVKVTYKLQSPYKNVGCVTVTGSDLLFDKSDWFVKIAGIASNLDIYPRKDRTVRMDFSFYGLTIPIDYEEGE